MRKFILLAFALACSSGQSGPVPMSSMERTARALLACNVGALSWSVVEPGGGTVDPSTGMYTAPGCTAPYADATYHLSVNGCGRSATIPVQVTDNVKNVQIMCAVVAPETCCRIPDPILGVVMPMNGTAQFYAATQFNCAGHVVYSATPPALCP